MFVFCVKQKTAYEMRIRDWSSDVCSSDLIAFDRGELAKTVALRSVKTRVSNVRDFQASNYGLFRAAAIAIAENYQQARNLLDKLTDLDHGDLPWLARLAPAELRDEVTIACVEELARRIAAWLALRHRPGQEFVALADAFVACDLLDRKGTRLNSSHYCA